MTDVRTRKQDLIPLMSHFQIVINTKRSRETEIWYMSRGDNERTVRKKTQDRNFSTHTHSQLLS